MSAPEDSSGRKRGFFYGWWIVIAGGLGMSITAGINFHGFGNFIIPLTNEFGWNRTTISGVFSLARMESGLLGPLEGWLVDRVGPRRLMLVGVPLMGVGYVLMSRVDSLAAFFFVYIFAITLGNSLGMSTPMAAAVANWFNRKRGLAFGIMWSGVGLGGFFVPAIGWLISAYDWRTASVIIGVFTIVVGVPIASLMRHRPEPYGYMPDGVEPEPDGETGGARTRRQPDLSQDFTAREALMTSSFWYLTLSIAARSLVSGGVGLHLVPYFVDLGASDVFAAALAGSVGVMSIPGRFGLSAVSDYLNRRYVMAVSLFLMSIAIVFMARATECNAGDSVPHSVLSGAGRHIGHTAVAHRGVLRAQGIRDDTGLSRDDPDDWDHHRAAGFRVCLRHDRQLRVGVSRIRRGYAGVARAGADDEGAGAATAHAAARLVARECEPAQFRLPDRLLHKLIHRQRSLQLLHELRAALRYGMARHEERAAILVRDDGDGECADLPCCVNDIVLVGADERAQNGHLGRCINDGDVLKGLGRDLREALAGNERGNALLPRQRLRDAHHEPAIQQHPVRRRHIHDDALLHTGEGHEEKLGVVLVAGEDFAQFGSLLDGRGVHEGVAVEVHELDATAAPHHLPRGDGRVYTAGHQRHRLARLYLPACRRNPVWSRNRRACRHSRHQ